MGSFRSNWWRVLALPLSLFTVFAGFGNMLEPEDTAGPNWQAGAVAYAVATLVALGLVIAGLGIRRRNRKVGSSLIAVGVMPAYPMAIMFWFPPVALVGLLSIAISLAAFIDAPKAPQTMIEPPVSEPL